MMHRPPFLSFKGTHMLLFSLLLSCADTPQTDNTPLPNNNTTSKTTLSKDAADFEPCVLQEVRACYSSNSSLATCNAYLGIFGVYRDSLVNHPLAKEPEKNCNASDKMKYIDKGYCPTENVLHSYVIWSVPNRIQPAQQQGYQVVYKVEKTDNNTIAILEKNMKTMAAHPQKRIFKCDAKGKLLSEL